MEKFIPAEKLSKKAKKELDARKRNTWSMSPVAKVVPNKKALQSKNACRVKD